MYAKTKKAFTIVELVIVIAVIAILMGIMFVGGTAISNNAKESSLDSDFRTFETNLKAMINDPGANVIKTPMDLNETPNTAQVDLIDKYFEGDIALKGWAANNNTSTGSKVAAFEAESSLKDPYGMPYKVVVLDNTTTNHTDISFIVYSYGKNKQTATEAGTFKWDKDDVVRVIRIWDSVVYTSDIGPNAATKLTGDLAYQQAVNDAFVGAGLTAAEGVNGSFTDTP